MKRVEKCFAIVAAICMVVVPVVSAQKRIMMNNQPGAGGMVNLPYQQSDSVGNNWMIYDGGWLRQNGPQQLYGQAAQLIVNGNGTSNNNQGKLDEKTGELVLENVQPSALSITRRVLISKDDQFVRYIDVFHNTQAQEQTVNVTIQTNINFGINSAANVEDPKHKDHTIGWVAMTGVNRAAVEMYAGKGSKFVPTINYQQGNNVVSANFTLTVPANKSAAIMHLYSTAASQEAGQQMLLDYKESQAMHSIPADLRHIIVNFNGGSNFVGNYEILRGDLFDVVELRSGDLMKGTLKEETYKLATFYGNVELPKDKVIGIINVGQFRPRQLLVTADGQIFGGKIDKDSLSLELSSGQVTQIPLSQISRVGYRKRPGELEDWVFDKPFVLMRAGDRMNIEMPTAPMDISTRYGLLKLDPKSIASIAFQSEDVGVHEIFLTDGSKFAGLVNAPQFEMKLADGTTGQPVKFPASSVMRLQLAGKIDDTDDTTPTLTLANEDLMVGTLVGTLKLDTAFDTLTVNAPEIRKITHAAQGSPDVQITLWDNTQVSGQLEEQTVQCKLGSGATLDVPLALVVEYNQPMPLPSPSMIEKIKATVAQLSVDDWKQRDQAEANLVKMGQPVIGVLNDMKANEPPEAQQRIEAIIKQLGKGGSKSKPAASATPVPMPMIDDFIMN